MNINSRVPLLDHGYLQYIEYWGSDERIIEAARMSTDKGFKGWGGELQCKYCGLPKAAGMTCPKCSAIDTEVHSFTEHGPPGDEKLLRYLWEHKHYTPFEMAGLTIEVQAPIFVLREWQRHRTQSYNELSARYTELPDLYYMPNIERLMMAKQNVKNKQGSELGFSKEEADSYQQRLSLGYQVLRNEYNRMLQEGVAREIARIILPVAQYSRMRASANLRNWLAFLTLRMDSGAQWEIRQYANALATVIKRQFPRTYELFNETSNNLGG